MELFDMHCHLDFLADAAGFARGAQLRGMGFFSATVTPAGFESARAVLADSPNVRVGVGLHPWWVHDGRCTFEDAERVAELVRETRFVGEVGLDFGKRCAHSKDAQLSAFTHIVKACAREGGKLLTIHAVRSADAVLDVLEKTRCLKNNQAIFHWYSDSNPALWRAIQAGCYFSVNPRMLQTKRGREYVKLIPRNRMLLETDLPPESDADFALDAWANCLREALDGLEEARGERLAEQLAENSALLLEG
ncbi:MAG: TatD family hydrolase [Coriobacteriia bacterium]|nr:TatD family hydrolase [Coriobacteriia bacterium]